MHGIRWLFCQKSERIPLVTARCVLLESAADSTSQGGIFRYSAFIFADKNSIVVIGTLIKRAEYYGAAEPPVRCGESHLSGLTEPPHFVY